MIVTGKPDLRCTLQTRSSPSILVSPYGHPRFRKGASSRAGPLGCPYTSHVLTCTNFLTPARSAARNSASTPSTLADLNKAQGPKSAATAAQWKTRSTPVVAFSSDEWSSSDPITSSTLICCRREHLPSDRTSARNG